MAITESIDRIHATTGRVVNSLEEQQSVIRGINQNINKLSGNANTIASSVQSASEQLDLASNTILNVNLQASEMDAGISLIQQESKDLSELAGSMQAIVRQFQLSA